MTFVLPKYLGAGIGLRKELFDELAETDRTVGWLEIVSENFMTQGGRARAVLDRCRERWPLIPHGVNLNVGGADPLDEAYLASLRGLADRVDAPFFSDHLCYCRLDGTYLHELLPLPARGDVAAHVAERIRHAVEVVGRPFLLENPTYYARMPGSTLEEPTFLSQVVEEADCGILLDINNIYVNAENHGYDARAYVDSVPLERVAQVHLAGHARERAAIIDNHGSAVPEPVWDLFRYMLERVGRPVSALVEWDQHIPSLDAVLDEADKARVILEGIS